MPELAPVTRAVVPESRPVPFVVVMLLALPRRGAGQSPRGGPGVLGSVPGPEVDS